MRTQLDQDWRCDHGNASECRRARTLGRSALGLVQPFASTSWSLGRGCDPHRTYDHDVLQPFIADVEVESRKDAFIPTNERSLIKTRNSRRHSTCQASRCI